MSRAMRSQMATTSLSWPGREGLTACRPCQALEHTRIPVRIVLVEYADGVDDGVGLSRPSFMTCSRLRRLALSPPSLTTISTFLSRLPVL